MFYLTVLIFVLMVSPIITFKSPLKDGFFNNQKQVLQGFYRLPMADDFFHIYGLPVGQGDSWVIQCPYPSGELSIIDMGTSDGVSKGFWNVKELKRFFEGNFHLIKNVILTHNHEDHYSLIANVLQSANEISGLSNIYISCTESDLPSSVVKWLNKTSGWEKLRTLNNGYRCGPTSVPCGEIPICSTDSWKQSRSKVPTMKYEGQRLKFPNITNKVLVANWGQQNNSKPPSNKNPDSIVMALLIGSVKVTMNGDFEDYTSSENEDGPQKNLVDFYGKDLITDIYHLSHHGAENFANKAFTLNAVQPRAIMVSSNPFYSHRHPRCSIIDAFVHSVKSLCKPFCNSSELNCCGQHPFFLQAKKTTDFFEENRVQKNYICGEKDGSLRTVSNNEYAIYTTVPSYDTLNIIEFVTDGKNWGFVNNFVPWTPA